MHEARSTLSRLLEAVEQGERVVIARAGKPVADLVPHRRADLAFESAACLFDYDSDAFDEPDSDVLALFEGH